MWPPEPATGKVPLVERRASRIRCAIRAENRLLAGPVPPLSAALEFWIWPLFRDRLGPPVTSPGGLASRPKPARPYIWRLIILIRFPFPSGCWWPLMPTGLAHLGTENHGLTAGGVPPYGS